MSRRTRLYRLPQSSPDMALLPRRDRFAPPPTAFEQQLIPVVSVLLASLVPLLPMIASTPVVPPFGFMMLLSWRLMRNDLWPVWAALPLGLFDDMFSGAPIGTAAAHTSMTLSNGAVLRRAKYHAATPVPRSAPWNAMPPFQIIKTFSGS